MSVTVTLYHDFLKCFNVLEKLLTVMFEKIWKKYGRRIVCESI